MVYLLKMVIFYSYVSHKQMVSGMILLEPHPPIVATAPFTSSRHSAKSPGVAVASTGRHVARGDSGANVA